MLMNKYDTLLWYNLFKKSLPIAVSEAAARHLARLGTSATHVILPLGEYPPEVGGLKVETDLTVKGNHLKVYNGGEK